MQKIIHQTWKTKEIPDPPFRSCWGDSWRLQNPSWEYRLWSDHDIQQFVKEEYPQFFSVWYSYPQAIMRVDAFRYLLLKKLGGLYVDLDFVCLKPLDEWNLDAVKFSCGDQGNGEFCNALMWAPVPELGFFEDIVSMLMENSSHRSVLDATGPTFLTRYARSRADLIKQISTDLIYPAPFWNKQLCSELRLLDPGELSERFPSANAVTIWTHSWKDQVASFPEDIPVSAQSIGQEVISIQVRVICSDSDRRFVERLAETCYSEPGSDSAIIFDQSTSSAPASPMWDAQILLKSLSDFLSREEEWLALVTERTYLHLPRFREMLCGKSGVIGSNELAANSKVEFDAGIAIHRSAVAPIISTLVEGGISLDGEELGKHLGRIIRCANIPWLASPFLRGDGDRPPSKDNSMISCTAKVPDFLNLVHTLASCDPLRIALGVHHHWKSKLSFYENGLFRRIGSQDYGIWDLDRFGHIELAWFKHAEKEIFAAFRDENGEFIDRGVILSLVDAEALFGEDIF